MKKKKAKFKNRCIAFLHTIPRFFYWYIVWVVSIILTYVVASSGTLASPLPIAQTSIATQSYNFAYDGRTRELSWVLEFISADKHYQNPDMIKFIPDSSLPAILQTKVADYEDSGFDIGLMAIFPGSPQFPLSLCSPMLPQFNRIYWKKVENYVKDLAQKLKPDRAITITGPLFLPHSEPNGNRLVTYEVIGESNIAVPTHFFKAIFYPANNPNGTFLIKSEIYVIPNENLKESIPLNSYMISQENFEKISGIIFPKDIKSYFQMPISPSL